MSSGSPGGRIQAGLLPIATKQSPQICPVGPATVEMGGDIRTFRFDYVILYSRCVENVDAYNPESA